MKSYKKHAHIVITPTEILFKFTKIYLFKNNTIKSRLHIRIWIPKFHIDLQLNQVMHLITGTLNFTLHRWLQVLSNIAPPEIAEFREFRKYRTTLFYQYMKTCKTQI